MKANQAEGVLKKMGVLKYHIRLVRLMLLGCNCRRRWPEVERLSEGPMAEE